MDLPRVNMWTGTMKICGLEQRKYVDWNNENIWTGTIKICGLEQ